ncbi:MAG: cytochrome c3 family protein, partial [Acidobacteriia bacterium]|nr:cytochrome c3 family protein [Terriglobia bacterium]
RRRIHVMVGAAVMGLLFLSGWFFVDVMARRSSFCENCHYMQPYVAQWKASTHRNVACVQCHPTQRRAMFAQFVKNVTGTYNPRPRAFVPDDACASKNCHGDMTNHQPVKFLSVSFPHKPHLGMDRRGIRLHCASCHGDSQEAGHVSVDPRICYLCHFKGQPLGGTLTWCGSCHGAPTGTSNHGGFIFDMKSYAASGVECNRCHVAVHEGDGEVSRDKCFMCHVSRVESISDTKLLHTRHAMEQQIRCLDCHSPIRHGNVKMLSVLDVSCESCHANLHAGPKEMYLGVGAKEASSTPSRMFAAQINCTGCHTQVTTQGGLSFLGQGNKAADPKACAACHDARFIPMVERWKSQGRQLVAEAQRLAQVGNRLAAQTPAKSPARTLASNLEFNARFLEQGHPVHNIEYAIKVVQASANLLGQMSGSKDPTATAKQIQPAFAKTPFSYCAESCHGFIPRKEPYDFQGTDFPHTYHVQKAQLTCDTCHQENRHTQLTLAAPSDCAACHHSSTKIDCARCHSRQASFYRGKFPASLGVPPAADGMASSVACIDCHDPTQPEPLKSTPGRCQGCHDTQGPKDLETWTRELKEERQKVLLLSEEARIALTAIERRGVPSTAYKNRLAKARARMEFIDKAKGVHNLNAAKALYGKSAEELTTLLSELTRVSNSASRTP